MQDKHSWPLGLSLHEPDATDSVPIIRKQTSPILAKNGQDHSALRSQTANSKTDKTSKDAAQPSDISSKKLHPPNKAWL